MAFPIIFWLGTLFFLSGLNGDPKIQKVPFGSDTPALFQMELEPCYLKWFGQPGERLSVFGNASDLAACIERVKANASYVTLNLPLPLVVNPAAELGVDYKPDFTVLHQFLEFVEARKIWVDISFGERNNPFFTKYPREFIEKNLDSFMRDVNGKLITVGNTKPDDPEGRPIPAINDPVITRLASQYIRDGVRAVGRSASVRDWIIGAEEAYPDYFGLPMGDFRPAFIKQFKQWVALKQWNIPENYKWDLLQENQPNPLQSAWFRFREKAIADRCAKYFVDFLVTDPVCRPSLYPTHGNLCAGIMRRGMGISPSLIAGACDGFEMGHIPINSDEENMNLIYITAFSAYGVPVTVPRLGNKTLDPTARGGGRTFTPVMLRRLVYECLGMGINHIGPIDWLANLFDGEWFIKDTPAEPTLKEVFSEIYQAALVLAGMGRLQPRVALFIADDSWIQGWDPRWTDFFQEARRNHWNITFIGDALVNSQLVDKIPVIISLENKYVETATLERFLGFLDAGGVVISWRSFGDFDGFTNPQRRDLLDRLRAHPRFVTVPAEQEGEPRRLINRFTTSNGAWELPHSFNAAPFRQIETMVLRQNFSRSTLQPLVLRKITEDVTVLPLTDGISILAVLINNTSNEATGVIRPLLKPIAGSAWSAFDVLREVSLDSSSSGEFPVRLQPNGTQLIWFVPVAESEVMQDTVDKAKVAFQTWEKLGTQTDFLVKHREVIQKKPSTQFETLKAYCLAQRVLRSYTLLPNIQTDDTGTFNVSVGVFDATGEPVSGADVRMRIIPDDFVWRTLEKQANVYETQLNKNSLSPFYDPAQGMYTHKIDAYRFIFVAEKDTYIGGATVTVKVQNLMEEQYKKEER